MSGDTFLARRWLLVLFALFTVAWFCTLDYRKLIKPDEGRYAEIAREMAASGDWVTPRLNGIKYFEKPPLQYWTTAAAYDAFGENEWTARLWTGADRLCSACCWRSSPAGACSAGRRPAAPRDPRQQPALAGRWGTSTPSTWGWPSSSQLAVCGFLLAQQDTRTRGAPLDAARLGRAGAGGALQGHRRAWC